MGSLGHKSPTLPHNSKHEFGLFVVYTLVYTPGLYCITMTTTGLRMTMMWQRHTHPLLSQEQRKTGWGGGKSSPLANVLQVFFWPRNCRNSSAFVWWQHVLTCWTGTLRRHGSLGSQCAMSMATNSSCMTWKGKAIEISRATVMHMLSGDVCPSYVLL